MGWLLLAGGSAAAGLSAAAQGPTDAGLRGRVVGAAGSPVGLATVEVRNDDGVEERVLAGADGRFALLHLAPGTYAVSVAGGTAGERSLVELEAGELREMVLSAAGSAEAAPKVGGVGGLKATEAEIAALPVRARDWEDVTELDSRANEAVGTAGAEPGEAQPEDGAAEPGRDTAQAGAAAGGLSYAGLPATQNGETVDGLSSEQGFRAGPRGAADGGARAGSSFAEGAVRSFRVLRGTYSAQTAGGGAGGVVAAVSRRAGSGLHGSVFALGRESAWGATNPFSVVTHYHDGVVTDGLVKPGGGEVQVGGSLGVPLSARWVPVRLRRASGVFVSVEEGVREDEIVSSPATAGFYQLTPTQRALLGNRGVGEAATNTALNYLDSLSGTTARTGTRTLLFARLDVQPFARDAFSLGYARNRVDSPAGAALGQASEAVVARGRGSLGDSAVQIDAGTTRWLHGFGAGLSSETRFGAAHDLEFETPRAPLAQEPAIGPEGLAPQVSLAPSGFAYGTPASLGRQAYPEEMRLQVGETVQWLRGRHLVSVGGDWSRLDDRVATLNNAEGSFLYDSGTTGGRAGGLVDWITDYTFNVHAYPNGGCPSIGAAVHDFCFRSFTQSFGAAETAWVTHEVAGFAEDVWRMRDNLTLTVGARYEYTLLPLPQRPNAALDEALAGALGATGELVGGATNRFPEDRNNGGPRVALTWSPGGGFARERSRSARPTVRASALTVRLGYGWFYGRVPGATVRAALADNALASGQTHIRITPTTETVCPQVGTGQGFGYPCAFLGAPPAAVEQTTSATVFAERFRLPAVQRATLEVERSLWSHGRLRAGYAMSLATQLPASTDLNIAPSTGLGSFEIEGDAGMMSFPGLREGELFVVPRYTARRLTNFGPVTAVVSDANATYHAGTVEAELRAWHGLSGRGSFTYSRAIDYGPRQSATPGQDTRFDPFANGYDKGLSSLNFPERFAGDLSYRTAVEHGPETLRKALGGWRLSALATAGSGAPYSYAVFGGTRLSGGYETLNGSGGAAYLPTVGRNTLRLPARGRVDVRLAREFAPGGGRMRAEVFAQAFNLLNTVSVSRVETRAFLVGTPAYTGAPTPLVFQDAAALASEGLSTPAFGTPLSSTTGSSRERQLELGARVRF